MPYEPLESKRMYVRAEELADRIWECVVGWEWFPKKSLGDQLTRAADSIGANIAEAGGRFHAGDVKKFLYYARGSLRETVYWVRRGEKRGLIPAADATSLLDELEQLSREINRAINFQKERGDSE